MPLPQTGATHYPAQIGLTENGRAIKMVGCLLFGAVKNNKSNSARCIGMVPCCGQTHDGYRAHVPQYPHETIT